MRSKDFRGLKDYIEVKIKTLAIPTVEEFHRKNQISTVYYSFKEMVSLHRLDN